MKRTLILALLVAVVAGVGVASAQTLTGTIVGKITDEQGGVLPGVNVTLTGRTGSVTQVTDATGQYRFLALTPGIYSIKAELQGFRAKEQKDIDVGLSQSVAINLALPVGGVAETVNVVANTLTVDTTTTATDTSVSQDLLFSMPINHANPAVNLLAYIPGVTDGSAFGGAADAGNSLMLDGVDTRDPSGGTAWTFWNYNIIDEVQVGALGQTAEYGGFTGAVVNTITKSGGNRFSFLSEYRYTGKSLSSKNASDEVVQLNPNLATPRQVLSLHDYTVQLGGPLIQNKLFFFASAQRYDVKQHEYAGYVRSELSPRLNLKFTYQLSPTDTIIGFTQYDQYNQKGRLGFIPGWAVTSQDQTVYEPAPSWTWNAQYRKVFGSSTFLEVKFLGWWGYYDTLAETTDSPHINVNEDGSTSYSGGAGYVGLYDRTRNQVTAAVTKYARLAGTHTFKFGLEIERSTVRDRFSYAGNGVYYYDYGGEPYLAYGYTYDLKGTNKRESYYAQDQWKVGRFTANLGVRLENIRGEAPVENKDLYKTFSVGPRLGFALDVTGKGSSVVRAYYGRLYEAANETIFYRALPGLTDTIIYEVGPNWSSLNEIDRVPAELKYTVADNIKHPRVDEYNVSWEQQFGKAYKLTGTYIYRSWANFINSVLIDGQWSPTSIANPLGGTLPLWKWANKGSVPQRFLIQNTDTVEYNIAGSDTPLVANAERKYQGLMLVFERAYRDRWQAQISYVLSKTYGNISNSSAGGISSGQFETPNTIIGNYGGPTSYNRTHAIKVFAGYQIPRAEVSVNGYFSYLSGWPYAAYTRVSSGTVAWSGSLNVNINERGSSALNPLTQQSVFQWTQPEKRFDVRFEKIFKYGVHRFGVYADIQNLFNWGGITGIQTRYPSASVTDAAGNSVPIYFGGPTALQAARQATFGLRWSF